MFNLLYHALNILSNYNNYSNITHKSLKIYDQKLTIKKDP